MNPFNDAFYIYNTLTAGFKPHDDNLIRTRPPKYWSWESPKQPIVRCEYYKYQQKKRKQKKRNRKNKRGY